MSSASDRPGDVPEDPELEGLLRELPAALPEPAFRAGVRGRFLTGPAEGASRPGEADRTDAPLAEGFERWLAGFALAPPARDPFREQVRGAFLSERALEGARPTRLRLVLVSLAAAAAIVAITFLLPRGERWRIHDLGGEGTVEVAGEALDPGERGRIADELTRGTTLRSARRSLTFALDELLSLHVLPDSEVAFEPLPDLASGAPLRFVLRRGEMYVKTHAGYPGNPIRVATSEVEVGATGTGFGVLVDERGTCVCVADGAVLVRGSGGAPAETRVPERTSYLVFRGGAMAPKLEPFGASPDPGLLEHTSALVDFARD